MNSTDINYRTADEVDIVDEENGNFDRSWRDQSLGDKKLSEAAQSEADLSVKEALKYFPNGILWCLVISRCVVMEGYDTSLLGNFFAFPFFQITFGDFVGSTEQTPSGYQLTAARTAGISQSAGIATFFGTLLNGYLFAKFGTKKVVIGALALTSLLQLIPFFAPSKLVLVIGQILNGFPWGVFATAAPAYASECIPIALRTYMTSYTNMCFIIGQLISAGVLKGFSTWTSIWGYRIPFAIQWV